MSDYNEVKDNLTGILMSAIDGACPADVDDISDALTLIEQQQARIAELEDKRNRELNRKESELQGAFSMIDELAATVDVLREFLRSLVEESAGVIGWHLNGAVADWDEIGATDILGETNDANLNAVKREVAKNAFIAALHTDMQVGEEQQKAEEYANTNYPSD